MYEAGKAKHLNADGFGGSTHMNASGKTPAELDAEKAAAKAADDALTPDEKNLRDITAACNAVKPTKYCRNHPSMSICTMRINKCIKQKLKIQGKARDAETDKESAEQMRRAMSEVDAPSAASGIGGDAPDDNTMLYVIGGIAVLGFAGIAFMMWKKSHPSVAA